MKKQLKDEKAITLIALVITVIVLLLLAGVAINALSGDNGILTNAAKAKEKNQEAEELEKETLNEYNTIIGQIAEGLGIGQGGEGGSGGGDDPIITPPEETTPGKPDEDGVFTVASTINGETAGTNNPKIPAGFKPLDAGTAVWGDGTSAPSQTAVNAGLVIQHGVDKSEYVWIPVEGLYTDADADAVASNSKVVLGRYDFSTSSTTPGKATKYTSTSYIEENKNDTANLKNYGNTIAKDIEGFISSVEANGGYYIARYEASKGANGRALSKISEGIPETEYNEDWTGPKNPITQGMLWNFITQPQAAAACQNLYEGINSDLVNSYAWDTALLFIQKNSGNADYSIDKSGNTKVDGTNSGLQNTGPRDVKEDVACNIYDMSGNSWEWTTETYSYSGSPCTNRGGGYGNSGIYASLRYSYFTSCVNDLISFRPLLYL